MSEINLPTSAKQDEILNAVKTSGKVLKSKVFDVPGTYSWKVPIGVEEVYLTGCGGGGSGAHGPDGSSGYYGACGGGAHYVEYYPVKVDPEQTVSITVANGGAPVSNGGTSGANGLAGGITTFGGYLSLSGGGGGNYSTRKGGVAGGPSGTNGSDGILHTSVNGIVPELRGGNCGTFIGGTLGSYNHIYPGGDGATGSGGGGVGINSEGTPSGKGGDGFLIIKWWE
ncbi:hypothetical protein [Rummeliibacillus sp. POC4]|uniref:glycine-rich domain-containing protein n=1 Tax=Rummeliibacillus sp. POC4 TaxID=2305899 RepID=UPI000E67289A|nr:hypothetical protein [Rummeliibacillus sp. POC4]RIJ65542.1 hypothetical protein D1606_08205 [Rummeliibacillus sp. POC4]